ncbi:hypothetical protein [Bartonella doshiae]|uniref:Uncharacterized protein n=2 Tax=Bartonella doshiae TaxID=33044 RepID=A0A380ZD06_BARDO|nr:hypothetical protein [Bartonella doshiae]EJF82211.1 hypothetical protein MCS_00132 [Bartonella doshiae NCTC 12862 = ATCC 700133]MBB6159583.1 hypothetical protein [Bartonella doshiae]SUV44869.1 Uncharacterised protein [Bartonella doshiae]
MQEKICLFPANQELSANKKHFIFDQDDQNKVVSILKTHKIQEKFIINTQHYSIKITYFSAIYNEKLTTFLKIP